MMKSRLVVGRFQDELGLGCVNFARHAGVAWIALNRPSSANAITTELARELLVALNTADGDSTVNCVVITGEGRHFCAGADLRGLREYLSGGPTSEPYQVGDLFPATARIRTVEVPVIAAVNGAAMAGGCDLALACDMRVASTTAVFAETYVKMGQVIGNGGAHLLPLLVGPAIACELAFTGDSVTAQRALEIGMVNRVVDGAALLDEVAALAARIASGPRRALAASKRAIYKGLRQTLAENLEDMYYVVGALHRTDDVKEGVAAFLERRPPRFNRR